MRKLIIGITILLTIATTANAGETYDIVIKAGADYRTTHVFSKNGVPIDLAGRAYASQFRSAPWPDGTVFANFSAVVTDAPAGKIRHSLSRRQTVNLAKKTGVWELKETLADGTVSYRYGGTVKVIPPGSAP